MHAELSNPFPNVRNELIARALSVERLLISTWRECFKPSAELFLHPERVANAQKRDIQDPAVLKIESVDLEGADA